MPLPIGLRGPRGERTARASGADLPLRRRDPLELGLGLVDLPQRHDLAAEDLDRVTAAYATAGIPMLRIPAAAAYDVKALRDQIASRMKDTAPLAA